MAILVVDDITDAHDVAELIHYLTRALASGDVSELTSEGMFTLTKNPQPTPTAAQLADLVRLGESDECENSLHRSDCSCKADAANTDPRQKVMTDTPPHSGPVPYVPCPNIEQHTQLTDCWMCWSDVRRGPAISPDERRRISS